MSQNRRQHKYIAKIPVGRIDRYFYTREELAAFYNKSKKSDSSNKTKTSAKKTSKLKIRLSEMKDEDLKKSLDKIDKFVKKQKSNQQSKIQETKKEIKKASENAKKVGKEAVSKVKEVPENVKRELAEKRQEAQQRREDMENKRREKEAQRLREEEERRRKDEEAKRQKEAKEIAENNAKIAELKKNKQFKDLPTKKSGESRDSDQEKTNPDYYKGTYEYTNNCSLCTTAYDLRRRGYDVEAIEADPNHPMTQEEIEKLYVNGHFTNWREAYLNDPAVKSKSPTRERAIEAMKDDMLDQGNGTYGHLIMFWSQGGGHDVIYTVEDNHVYIRDCQTNDKLELEDYLNYCSDFSYMRTDNLELSDEARKAVKPARKR